MTNLPNSEQAGNLDNIGVTRAEFRAEIGVLLEFLAQALGDVTGTYTTEDVVPTEVILQGTPTLEAGAEPAVDNTTLRLANTQWVKKNGRYVGSSAPAGPTDGTLWIDDTTNPYTIKAFNDSVSDWQIVSGVPSGTRMLFQQTAAPTGWTKDTSFDQHALRVTTGTVDSGGTLDFTGAFAAGISTGGTVASHVLTVAELPSHTHGVTDGGHNHGVNDPGHDHSYDTAIVSGNTESGSGDGEAFNETRRTSDNRTGISINSANANIAIQNTGAGNAHTHAFTAGSIDLAVKYVDVIIAQKD